MPTLYWGPWLAKICRGGPGYDFLGRQLKHLSSAYFQLLKPFLTFKGHRNTVLIAQNVAKAYIIDSSVYLFTQKPFVSSQYRLEYIFTCMSLHKAGQTNQLVMSPPENRHVNYRKVASSDTSRLKAHAGFFRLLMKGIFDP